MRNKPKRHRIRGIFFFFLWVPKACLVCIEVVFIFYFHFLYSFFIFNLVLIFCFHLFFFFLASFSVLSSSSLFFFFSFYDNHQQRESKSILWYDKLVIVEPTDLIFFTKMSLYSFSRKWKYQKVVFSFCIQILLFYIKNEN